MWNKRLDCFPCKSLIIFPHEMGFYVVSPLFSFVAMVTLLSRLLIAV